MNINYRFPDVYIESNRSTVRNIPVSISPNFAVIALIITMAASAKHYPIGIIFMSTKVHPEDRFLINQELFSRSTPS
ncbi:hypothetical protein [Microcoleus sp. S13C4]|uniref:hypothetical protein n=1 Tax=Microcoleus sp. S13C4 TaxID=3055410 RepID=UPI002FD31340